MTLLRNTFEGGTDGTTITVGNSGGASGDAFGTGEVSVGAGCTLAYSSDHPGRGSLGAEVGGVAGQVALMGHTLVAASKQVAAQFILYLTAYPTTDTQILLFREASGANLGLLLKTNGKINVTDDSGGLVGTLASANALPLNTFLLVDVRVEVGTTTSNGKVYWQYSVLDGAVLESLSTTTANLGTADLAKVRFGKTSSSGDITGMYLDAVAAADGVTAFITPPASDVLAATATADATSGTAPLTVTVTIDASGGSGSYTYDYDWGDGTSDLDQATNTKSHTYTVAGNYTIGWGVSDG